MEVAGLTLGIAALYSACIETAHRIESYKNFQTETKQFSAQFLADKAILQRWADKVGIQHSGLSDVHDRRLDSPEIALAVKEILMSLQTLLKATEGAQSKTRNSTSGKAQSARQVANVEESTQSTTTSSRKRDKISWTFGGKERFVALVDGFSTLVAKLGDLVPIDTSDETLSLAKNSPQTGPESKFPAPFVKDVCSIISGTKQYVLMVEKVLQRFRGISSLMSPQRRC